MTLHEMMGQFRPPFPVSVMEWKVQATNGANTKALAAPYADTRAYEDRLNEVVPDDWASRAEFLQAGDRLICTVHLTILGVMRAGDGESPLSDMNAATVAYAQAFKRACSRFGLGRYLYGLDTGWQEIEKKGRGYVFTGAAMDRLRQSYKQYCQGKVALEGNGHEPQAPKTVKTPEPTKSTKDTTDGNYPTGRWTDFRAYAIANLEHYTSNMHVVNALKGCGIEEPWEGWDAGRAAKCWQCLTKRLEADEDTEPIEYAEGDPARPFE